MMKRRRRLAWLLVLFMAVQIPDISVLAQEPVKTAEDGSGDIGTKESPEAEISAEDMEIEAKDSFASLVANTLEKSDRENGSEDAFRIVEADV